MIISKRRNQWPGSPSAPSPAARWLRSSSDIRAQQHYLGASLPFSYPTAFGKLQHPPPTKSLFSSDRPFHTQTSASHKAASSVPPLHRTPKTTHGDSGSGGAQLTLQHEHSHISTNAKHLVGCGFFWWIIGFGCVWVFFLWGGCLFSCLFLSFPYC